MLQIFAAVLALAWVPITSHCSWEGLIGGDMFKCAANTEQKGDCSNDADACDELESGSYKVPDTASEVPAPLLAVLLFELPILDLVPRQPLPQTAAPTEVHSSWQFFSRTALPPRAPSLA